MALEIMHAENPDKPITTRVQVVRIMAAFVSYYKRHLPRRVHSSGLTTLEMIIEAIRPTRVELYLNNMRIRSYFAVPASYLLPVGTTSNEAFHATLARITHGVTRIVPVTLHALLRVSLLATVVAGLANARGRTFTSYKRSDAVDQASAGFVLFTEAAWLDFVAAAPGPVPYSENAGDELVVTHEPAQKRWTSDDVPGKGGGRARADPMLGLAMGCLLRPSRPRAPPPPPPLRGYSASAKVALRRPVAGRRAGPSTLRRPARGPA